MRNSAIAMGAAQVMLTKPISAAGAGGAQKLEKVESRGRSLGIINSI